MQSERLTYEEIVLLQEILIKIQEEDFIIQDYETFDSLYNKVMTY